MCICEYVHKWMSEKTKPKPKRRPEQVRRSSDDLERVFASVARYFSLLSDPTRLKILHSICQAEQSVTAIVAATGATQTTVSRHLGLLHQAGVVSRRRERSLVYYRVADPMFVDICRSVCVQIAGRIDERTPLRNELLEFAAQH
jgi:DNA-binding transcriptional ArsR family regulator